MKVQALTDAKNTIAKGKTMLLKTKKMLEIKPKQTPIVKGKTLKQTNAETHIKD